MNPTEMTQYTLTLPASFVDELKKLVQTEQVASIDLAIYQAVESYLVQIRKNKYTAMMQEAAKDEAFVSRTLKCDEDFAFTV